MGKSRAKKKQHWFKKGHLPGSHELRAEGVEDTTDDSSDITKKQKTDDDEETEVDENGGHFILKLFALLGYGVFQLICFYFYARLLYQTFNH